jgi:hypothetical protein
MAHTPGLDGCCSCDFASVLEFRQPKQVSAQNRRKGSGCSAQETIQKQRKTQGIANTAVINLQWSSSTSHLTTQSTTKRKAFITPQSPANRKHSRVSRSSQGCDHELFEFASEEIFLRDTSLVV